ncbi:MAG: hypothetical protein FH748_05675 [Balneolaceae bacterium]|nr:hypothetical protein [Balneolaceae bacterium]
MRYLKITPLFIVIALISACSQPKNNKETAEITLSQQIDTHINNDEYEKALELLQTKSEEPDIATLSEKTHLNYGIYLIYNADPSTMRENANNALGQFIEVLKINPDNQKAISEIEQILSIYRSFPHRKPKDEVMEDLKELGFEI